MAQRKKKQSRKTAAKKPAARKKTAKKTKKKTRKKASPAATVVYIHGIGAQPVDKVCKRNWDFALFGKDMGERTRMAYWADINHGVSSRSRTRSLSQDVPTEASLDPEELIASLDVPAKARQEAAEYANGVLAESFAIREGGGDGTRGGRRTRGVKAKVLPSFLRKPMTSWITNLFIQDTAAYFYNPTKRKKMQDRLKKQLSRLSGPVILVAHSQGTIISHDVLSTLGKKAKIQLFVTLGSPLGLSEVQDHLSSRTVPPGVETWANFADLLDPVALDKRLASDFKPASKITDKIVINRDSVRIRGFNPHSSTGYLGTTAVQNTVRDPMREKDTMASVRVRSDVARVMVTDDVSRHPVLIELRDYESFPELADQDKGQTHGLTLPERSARLFETLTRIVGKRDREAARIDRLRRYISARLTTAEIQELVAEHDADVHSVWKNSTKRKGVHRSGNVVHAPAARLTYRADGEGITWAVLDTGVQGNHPHFDYYDNVAQVWDCTTVGAAKRVRRDRARDPDGHGTHVAGIISGEALEEDEEGKLYSGMAPLAKIRAYRVLDDEGGGEDGWIIKALDHIASTNEAASGLAVHGVNLSLGGYFDPEVFGCGHSPICSELRRLWRQGVVVCVSCGNEGQITVDTNDGEFDLNTSISIGDPANLEECIAVGSVNADQPHTYGISFFSSRGPTADGRAKPDVVAPGENIVSCNSDFKDSGSDYIELSGTSMACPHVSGLIAAFLSVRREFIGQPDKVKEILIRNCTDIGRDRYHQGAGIPNLIRMLAGT